MIPREFFDWVLDQWWGIPAFVVLVIGGLIVFSALLAAATGGHR